MPLHHHAERIAHQQHIHARAVHQRGEAGFIASKHGNFLALRFHFLQGIDGNHKVSETVVIKIATAAMISGIAGLAKPAAKKQNACLKSVANMGLRLAIPSRFSFFRQAFWPHRRV